MNPAPVVFPAIPAIQTYAVPVTGCYLIEAAGAQGGDGGGPGGRGARMRGMFHLERGEVLHLVVGQRGGAGSSPFEPAGGGGGGSFVWKGVRHRYPSTALPAVGANFDWQPVGERSVPELPLLAAGAGGGGNGGDASIDPQGGDGAAPGGRDGHGGQAAREGAHYSGGGGAGWLSTGSRGSAPTYCAGGAHWQGGAGCTYFDHLGGDGGFGGGGGGAFLGFGSGGGGGFSGGGGGSRTGEGGGGGGSFNSGTGQLNLAGVQTGDGFVTLLLQLPVAPAHDRSAAQVFPASGHMATLHPGARPPSPAAPPLHLPPPRTPGPAAHLGHQPGRLLSAWLRHG